MKSIACALLTAATIAAQTAEPLRAPRVYPPALNPDRSVEATFSVFVPTAGRDTVVLESRKTGSIVLADDGVGADAVEGDLVFTAKAALHTAGETVGQCHEFRVRVGARTSGAAQVCVTGFRVGPAPVEDTDGIAGSNGALYVPDRALVEFDRALSEREIAAVAAAAGASVVGTLPGLGLHQLRFRAAADSESAVLQRARSVGALPGVRRVIPSTMMELTSVTPNDSRYQQQYGPRQARVNEAWVVSRGGPMIAVIDTGVDTDHPELSSQIFAGGVDWATGKPLPEDDHGHGSHVMGIAAARSNNQEGVAGVAWKSKVLPERVFKMVLKKKDPVGSNDDTAAAIDHAVSLGARVINLSLGSYGDGAAAVLCPAVEQAVQAGVVVVASAGNKGSQQKAYPAGCDGAISVGSVGAGGVPSDFSNYGDWVDVAAAGESVISSALMGGGNGLIDCPLCTQSGYAFASGTSMSSPHVAGIAAMVVGRYPAWTPERVKRRLKETSRKIDHWRTVGGLVDAMGALLDAGFEDPSLHSWAKQGTMTLWENGGNVPQGSRAALLSTNDAPGGQSQLVQKFDVQAGVGSLSVSMRYAVITGLKAANPKHRYEIRLRTSDGVTRTLAAGPVFDVAKQAFEDGLWSGWRTGQVSFVAPAGEAELRILVTDEGDAAANSILVVDDLRFSKPLDVVMVVF